MDAPKKGLRLFSEPEVSLYTLSKLEDETYLGVSRGLVDSLGLTGRVRELLIIRSNDMPFTRTSEKDTILLRSSKDDDRRNRPYDATLTLIEEGRRGGSTLGALCDKEELLTHIDDYVRRNMDYAALAVVEPSLVDFVTLLLNGRYDISVINIFAGKKEQ